jgi:hypothetical protein
MIWLTWRQLRLSALTVLGLLAVAVVAFAFTGPGLKREYAVMMARCEGQYSAELVGSAQWNPSARCSGLFDSFFEPRLGVYLLINLAVLAVPLAAGMFWGAPLVSREYETGTRDVVWQQSIPRRRWLAVKLGIVGLVAVTVATVATAVVGWWAAPLDATAFTGLNQLSPPLFTARGFVPAGYAALAFTIGVTAGLLLRRAAPAMAVTFVVFLAFHIAMPLLVRPHYAEPLRYETAVTAENMNYIGEPGPDGLLHGAIVDVMMPDVWVLSNGVVDSAGTTVDGLPAWAAECATPDRPDQEPAQLQCLQRLGAEGYRQAVTYHPGSRFWAFQTYETALLGLFSLLLAGFCLLRIRSAD